MKVIERLLCPLDYHCNFCEHVNGAYCTKDPRRMLTFNSTMKYND